MDERNRYRKFRNKNKDNNNNYIILFIVGLVGVYLIGSKVNNKKQQKKDEL